MEENRAGIKDTQNKVHFSLYSLNNGTYNCVFLGNGRLSIGGAQNPLKSRPRIPTPDVTKEVVDRENRLALHAVNLQNPMSGVTLMQHHGIQNASYPNYPSSDMPVVQVVLSPIQELDGTSSVNNTLHANQPGTAALAQAILSPGVGPVLTTPVSLPMTVSQLTSLGLAPVTNSPLVTRTMPVRASPTFAKLFNDSPKSSGSTAATITEHQSDDDLDECNSNGSKGSGSHVSNTTASIKSKSDGETERKISMNTPTSLASPNLESLNSEGGETSRKTSVASQSNNSSSPKREVYV